MRRFRLGMMMGFGAGYVLGTRAGHERYEQILTTWRRLMRSEPAQQLADEAQHAATEMDERARRATSDAASQAAGMPREATGVRAT